MVRLLSGHAASHAIPIAITSVERLYRYVISGVQATINSIFASLGALLLKQAIRSRINTIPPPNFMSNKFLPNDFAISNVSGIPGEVGKRRAVIVNRLFIPQSNGISLHPSIR